MTATPHTHRLHDEILGEAERLGEGLLPRIDAFRTRQLDDGTVPEPGEEDRRGLLAIKDEAVGWFAGHGRANQADALAADIDGWLAAGLDTPPHFARSRDALTAPADGDWAAFLAPVQTTNSVPPVGRRLEFFLVRRKEPDALSELAVRYPHPKNNCQATVLLAGSEGLTQGNCIVFFPENVAAHDKVAEQAYAIFFFSKFRRIHETYAVPSARAILTPDSVPHASTGMDPEVCYQARSLWGYLHDYFHHQGQWPLDRHIKLKMNWFIGLLEELKVDAKTVLACHDDAVPYADEQIAMILLERMFRYPLDARAVRNFDAGTGVFLYSWLRERGALADHGGRLSLSYDRVLDGLRELVDTIEAMEASVGTPEEYRAAARELVRTQLRQGAEGDRYAFTDDQLTLVRARDRLAALPPLHFAPAEV
ncbi:DUF6421 family protein [Streptomyces melanogenes]|uniref:DUF6421 family protein n=1 Tax=Streptomyces melanogenes TaxID=67326 RepID=UPI00167C6A60|nr:DUF6421 family protein [Streptomyces melanogenes]GGP46597.1 hypothetical protein GCM10010278_24400 [Streptomyces melanogenes]